MRSELSASYLPFIGGKLSATVSANALTVSVKTTAGNDPSPGEPVYITYRSLTNGTYDTRIIVQQTSLTVSAGSTLGTSNLVPFRLWVVLFDNDGTMILGLKNCVSSTPIFFSLPETAIASPTAEGGAGAADSPGVFFTSAALSFKRYRVVGYLDWNSGLATAGTWSSAPDVIQLFRAGDYLPGDLVQSYRRYSNGFTNSVASIPYDDTLPQSTEGLVGATFAGLTPTSPVNYWINDVEVEVSCSAVGVITLALFKNSENDACAAKAEYMSVADKPITLTLHDIRQIAATSSQNFSTNVGGESGTIGYNGTSAARKLGGALFWHHTMSEMMV